MGLCEELSLAQPESRKQALSLLRDAVVLQSQQHSQVPCASLEGAILIFLIQSMEQFSELCKLHRETAEKLANLSRTLLSLYRRANLPGTERLVKYEHILQQSDIKLRLNVSRIVVMGETSSGKVSLPPRHMCWIRLLISVQSSLINYLLGWKVVPTGIYKTTAHLCEISSGEPSLKVLGEQGAEVKTDNPKEFERYLSLEYEENRTAPKQILLRVPSSILQVGCKADNKEKTKNKTFIPQEGVVIVDTPGLNDIEMRDKVVQEYAQLMAIGIIVVIDAGQGLTRGVCNQN